MPASAIIPWSSARGCCWRWRFGAGGCLTRTECRSDRVLQRLRAHPPKALLPAAIVFQRVPKTLFIEVRPQTIAEVQLRERGFPEQKIAEPPFVPGADQQIDGADCMGAVIGFEQQAMKALGSQIGGAFAATSRLQDAVLRGVVDGDAQQHSGAARAH